MFTADFFPLLNPGPQIYCLRLTFPLSPETEKKFFEACSETRKKKVQQLSQIEDRQRSLAAGWLLQKAATEFFPHSSSRLFTEKATDLGRPFFEEYPDIYVSLSHSGNYVACVLSRDACGIDVENLSSEENLPEMAALALTSSELEIFKSLEASEQQNYFFEIWTKKEALLKALGIGFLESTESANILRSQKDWHYHSSDLPGFYKLALCWKKIK